jgi:hypothetical protein
MSSTETDKSGSVPGMVDRIVLTLPADRRLRSVATLVLGGIGSRLALPYEKLDDLQLAVLSLLGVSEADTVTIEIDIDDEGVAVTVGPLREAGTLDAGLLRVLERLVDKAEPTRRDAPSREWITLRLAHGQQGLA